MVPKRNKRLIKKVKDKGEDKAHTKVEKTASLDDLVAPLTWAQRLKRVFKRAAIGLILAYAPCVVVPHRSSDGAAFGSLTQT